MKAFFIKKIPNVALWIIIIAFFGIGITSSLHHSVNFLMPYNYALGPNGDDAYDAANVSYPIITGEDSWWHIIKPFGDHRNVTERLITIFNFIFTDGTQSTGGIRFLFFLWATYFVTLTFIFQIKSLKTVTKFFLSAMLLNLTFLSCRIGSFVGESVFTWPQVFLYSFCAFFCLSKYTNLEDNAKQAYYYLLLTSLFTILTIFSFNIGLLIWPIIFVVLFKQNKFHHLKSWLIFAGLSYFVFFNSIQTDRHRYWAPNSLARGLINFFSHPLDFFNYFSRFASLPFDPNSFRNATVLTYCIGSALLIMSFFLLLYFLKKAKWGRAEPVLFSCIAFGFIASVFISIARFGIESEFAGVGARFWTVNLFLWTSIIIAVFFIISTTKNKMLMLCNPIAFIAASIWLFFCLLGQATMMHGMEKINLFKEPILLIDASTTSNNHEVYNKFFIALATGVPLNDSLIDATGGCNYQEKGKPHLTYMNKIQREYNKAGYSLWPYHAMNQKLDNLSFNLIKPLNLNKKSVILISKDLRKETPANPAVFVQVRLPRQEVPTSTHDWYLIATNSDNAITGFGIRTPLFIDLPKLIFYKDKPREFTWNGVINSSLVKGDEVNLWLANKEDKLYWFIGNLKI